ncbi:MAG: hypothetical protein RR416_00485 [Clostridia bacterium]
MNKIEKELRESAKMLLPDEKTKNDIKSRLGICEPPKQSASQRIADAVQSARAKRRKIWGAVAAFACVCIICCSGVVFGIGNKQQPVSETYISLDINPSIEIVADKNDVVTAVKAINGDAVVLLYGMDGLVGKKANEVCELLVGESIRLGFVTPEKKIGLVAVNANWDKEKTVNEYLKKALESKFAAQGAKVETPDFKISKMSANFKKTTPNKQALIENAKKASGLDESALKGQDVQKLNEIAKGYDEQKNKKAQEKLEKAFDDGGKLDEAKKQYTELVYLKEAIEKEFETIIEKSEDEESAADIQVSVDAFNKKYPQYKFVGSEYDKEKLELHLEEILNKIEVEIKKAGDNIDKVEDEYDDIKKQCKQEIEDEEDEDDD